MGSAASFLWHDYETSGVDPRRDRPTQFACWRTDEELRPLEEPRSFYCKPAPDLLPDPGSCVLTGLLPDALEQSGLIEPEFAAAVHAQLAQPGTCNAGYNSMRFDDEVSRHLFWRQLHDPYAHEWANGNSRFDLIDVLRTMYALRPQGFNWPLREDGQPSFKLELLASSNHIEQQRAHDAIDDVRALVELARRVRSLQPRLWAHALRLRSKAVVAQLLGATPAQPLVHVSQRFAASRGCLAVVLPLLRHPLLAGRMLVVDLDADPAGWMELDAAQLAERVYLPGDSPLPRLPVKAVHFNRAPMLAPLGVLDGVDLQRIGLDLPRCLAHARQIAADSTLAGRLAEAYTMVDTARPAPADLDAGLRLYDGFVANADRALCRQLLKAPPQQLVRSQFRFADARLHELLWQRQARWYPQSLSAQERQQWQLECSQRLAGQGGYRSLAQFDTALQLLRESSPSPQVLEMLQRLQDWRQLRHVVAPAADASSHGL